MIEMLLLACSLSTPAHCKTVRLGAQDAPLLACVMASQQQAAQWATSNPRWSVRKVVCRAVSEDA